LEGDDGRFCWKCDACRATIRMAAPNQIAALQTPLIAGVVTDFAIATGAGQPEMWAVLRMETSGCGFLPDKRPKILFERHKFSALTGGIYDQSHPDNSQAHSRRLHGLGGANRYNRLALAVRSIGRALCRAPSGHSISLPQSSQRNRFRDVMSSSTMQS
jgi:N-acetylmuramidase